MKLPRTQLRFKLQYKITFLIVLVVALLLSGSYLYLNKTLTDYAYRNIRANLNRALNLSQTYFLKVSGDATEIGRLDLIAEQLGKDLGLRATLIAKDGTVLGESDVPTDEVYGIENHLYRPEVQDALKYGYGESRRYSTTVNQDMLYAARLFETPQRSGVIRLAIPLADVLEITSNLRRFLALAFAAALMFAVILSGLAAHLIAKPIKEMSAVAKEIAAGKFENKVRFSSNDEIGDLTESINYMSEQIKSRMDEVIGNRSRLEAVLLSMFEGMMVVDEEGRIILMNQRLKDFLRVAQEPLGRRPLEVVRNIEIQELADKALLLERGVESQELNVHLPEEKTLQIHATPVIRAGKTEGAVLVFHDITELRRLEKVRQDFVANVSHELRTPLTSIKGYAETLLEGALEDKENAREFIEIIAYDANRLANLVNDLLDLARIESDKLDHNIKPLALEPLVERVIAALSKTAGTKAVELMKEIPAGLAKVSADEGLLSQLLLNLVDNAIKYNKIKGSVVIAAKEEADVVRVSVADTGIGIPAQDLPRIFERFYRVDKARSREMGGTGLGLSIVKHIVQALGGEITVESTPGSGSTFIFTLPKAS